MWEATCRLGLHEVALNGGVNLDARAHGGGHGDALDVLALGGSRLDAEDLGVEAA